MPIEQNPPDSYLYQSMWANPIILGFGDEPEETPVPAWRANRPCECNPCAHTRQIGQLDNNGWNRADADEFFQARQTQVNQELDRQRLVRCTCVCCGLIDPYTIYESNVALSGYIRRRRICDNCLDTYYRDCNNCMGYYRSSFDRCPNSDNHASYYDGLVEDDFAECIRNYNYRPRIRFHGNGPLYLGMELEIHVPSDMMSDAAKLCIEYLGHDERLGCLKRDGSVYDGFEIVLQPMSYEWLMSEFPWEMFDKLSEMGCFVDSGVGMHVHVSRAGFASPAHMFRWMKFFYRNESDICKLSRRDPGEWGAFRSSMRDAVKYHVKGQYARYGRYSDTEYPERYSAINVLNDATLEVRTFRASLDVQEIKANLGLVHGSIEYTRKLSAQDILRKDAWKWTSFASWIDQTYSALRAEMDKLCAS